MQSYTLFPTWASDLADPTGPSNNTFAIYGDANSIEDLVPILINTCSVASNYIYGANFTATPFNTAQYYRGSSFALTLNGYNNSLPNVEIQNSSQTFTVFGPQPTPLPAGVNTTYFSCLNSTIGSYIGLIDSDLETGFAVPRVSSGSLTATAALLAVLLNLCY